MPYGSDSAAAPPRGAQDRYQLFISYAGADRQVVEPFVAQLEADGFVVFFDQRGVMQPGGLMSQLADALDASDHVIACLTPAYLRGKWPMFELASGAYEDPVGDRGRIIPVWFDHDGVETLNYLRHLTHFDLSRHDPYGRSYGQLRDAIRDRLAHPEPPGDREEVAASVAGALDGPDDPEVTLFRVRRAAQRLARRMYQEVLHADPGGRPFESLADDLLRSGRLGEEAAAALGTLRAFGPDPTGDEPGDQAVRTSLSAVERLHRYLFPEPAGHAVAAGPVRLDPSAPAPARTQVTATAADLAWPLGDEDVVVWDERSGTLRCLRGDDLRWRDTERIDVRRVATSADGRLAIGGWEGRVRYFVAGPGPAAAFDLDGAVGDLRCARAGLIAGSWKHGLVRVGDDGRRVRLAPVQGGVHRIAISRHGDRFAVAQLTGRVVVYDGDRGVAVVPIAEPVADLAYAGTRLVLVTHDAVAGWRLDGRLSEAVPVPGATGLLPVSDRACCLLTVEAADGPALVSVDEEDRHVTELWLRHGERPVSADATGARLVTRRPDGCAYRRDGAEVVLWPGAAAAAVSGDGRRIAVCTGGRVESYRDAP